MLRTSAPLSALLAMALLATTPGSAIPQKLPGPLDAHFAVVMTNGCSGSTWLWRVLKGILQANSEDRLPVMLSGGYRTAELEPQSPKEMHLGGAKEFLKFKKHCQVATDQSTATKPDVNWHTPKLCTASTLVSTLASPSSLSSTDSLFSPPTIPCTPYDRLKDAWLKISGDPRCRNTSAAANATKKYIMPFVLLKPQVSKSSVPPSSLLGHLLADKDHKTRKKAMHDIVESVYSLIRPNTTRIVAVIRENELDRLVCSVRDCFDLNVGHLVNTAGDNLHCTSHKIMSARRATNVTAADDQLKVRLDPQKLKRYLQMASTMNSGMSRRWWSAGSIHSLADRGFEYKTIRIEDLSEYEYSNLTDAVQNGVPNKQLDVSMKAWADLLISLGLPAPLDTIKNVLYQSVTGEDGHLLPPRAMHSHSKEIFNNVEVKAKLQDTPYIQYWRT